MDEETRVGMGLLIRLGLLISMLGLFFTIVDMLITPQDGDTENGDE